LSSDFPRFYRVGKQYRTMKVKIIQGKKTMKKMTLTALPLLALVLVMGSRQISLAYSDEPVLIKATFFSHTNDDNKDHDTGVYVKVRTADNSSMIAHADNRDNSGDDGTEYKDGSDHQFDLDLDAAGLSKPDSKKFKVQICQHTHGHDTWKFDGRVVLYFSNKTNLIADGGGITLENEGACTTFGN